MTDIATLLGPAASVPPTPVFAAALRKAVMRPRDQYPKWGQQGAPICLDGPDPYAYALHHGVVTEADIRPYLELWRDQSLEFRGLGSGHPVAKQPWINPDGTVWTNQWGVPIPVTIHDCQHESFQQYLTGAIVLDDATSKQAVVDLRNVVLADPALDPKHFTCNQRELGRPMRAMCQEGSQEAVAGAGVLFTKVLTQSGTKAGLPYYTLNVNAGADHMELPINVQQSSTILGGEAALYGIYHIPGVRDSVYHGLSLMEAAQQSDGTFANDMGWNASGASVVESDPNKVLDLWCVPNIIMAKYALGDLWPPKAQKILDAARQLWLAMGYTKPGDKNFSPHNVLSITIGCAPEYGFKL